MSAASPRNIYAPLKVEFDSEVEITIHSAFLQTARLLQCDPMAHVSVSTLHVATDTRRPCGGVTQVGESTRIVKNERPVGSTRRLHFTSKPNFSEIIRFVIPFTQCRRSTMRPESRLLLRKTAAAVSTDDNPDERFVDHQVLITITDAQEQGYGQAVCPFLLHVPSSSTEPQRIMLQPRNKHDKHDPVFKSDVALLAKHGVDDFGFVDISWRVSLIPHGGALITALQPSVSVPTFPIGLVLRATWLVAGNVHQPRTQYTTSVEFGGQDRFLFEGTKPLFLTIQSAAQLERAIVHCTFHDTTTRPQSYDVAVPLPVPPMASFAMERDVWWTTPVRTACGVDLGILLASIRLAQRPLDGSTPFCTVEGCREINNPIHQSQFAHVAKEWGRAPPNTPPGAYYPLFWESEQHIARVAERQWRHDCVVGARPSIEHVRHLLEVLAGRIAVDGGVNGVAAVYFNHAPTTTLQQHQVKQFLVTCAFHAKEMTVQDAARFCFFALRRDMEQAITKEDVVFILDHALIGKTIDMPEKEVSRRVDDIFGDGVYITFDDFMRYFINNYAMWYQFGVPITTGDEQAAQGSIDVAVELGPNAQGTAKEEPGEEARGGAAVPVAPRGEEAGSSNSNPQDVGVWRRFIARVQHSNRAFSVTAHVNDSIAEVMVMVQNSTGIRASCQEWRMNGVLLDPKATVGSTKLGLSSRNDASPEVVIIERDESLRLVMLYKEKSVRWELRIQETEKVLRLRALVQQKTLIPLSRCVMRANGQRLQDRHPLQHYQLQNGDVVEVMQE
ncbi:hypothetical protein, conserved [Trypanosoma brucei gambiense DAL972]|uniref:Ubiquitin-like domain-containing protein n=1 Tax=Trypanosoma brucei gambiense (strain MHOM/CI/86/DAL972) TaxID=679716 RepID=D0A522_TRYB9|nr:hypothetical protein, conserved [Trypanosoma brucei gambiense DAL972]CBH16366.1 hypothetical protein, conserved [Trypanosoma brucei gambiense DAL972]|eukprot:XP_011778630.1 hypothetical protein, conserved [Trypanosoma brucei gambiense DAL972]